MANFTATPTSTNNIIDVFDESGSAATTGTAHLKVTDVSDGTYVRQNIANGADSQVSFGTTSDATGSPSSMDSLDVTCRMNILGGWSDDTLEFKVQIYKSDGVTPLTDELTLATAAAGADQIPQSTWTEVTKSFTLNTNDAAEWTNAEVRFYWVYQKSKGADDAYIAVSEILLPGTYTAAIELGTTNIFSTGTVSGDALTQTHIETTTDIYSTASITDDAVVQTHVLGTGHLSTPSTIEGAAAFRVHDIATTDIFTVSTITDGGVTHTHAGLTTDLDTVTTVTGGGIATSHILSTQHLSSDDSIVGVDLVQTHVLGTTDTVTDSSITDGAVGFTHELGTTDLNTVSSITDGEVIHIVGLVVGDLETDGTISQVTLPVYEQLTYFSVPFDYYGIVTTPISTEITISSGDIGQSHILATTDIDTASSIQDGAVDTEHYVDTQSLVSDSTITDGAIDTVHVLSAQSLDTETTVTSAEVQTQHELSTQDLSSGVDITDAAIVHTNVLSTTPINTISTITDGALATSHSVSTQSLTTETTIQSVAGVAGLICPPLITRPSFSSVTTTQTHILGTTDITSSAKIQTGSLSGEHRLAVDDLDSSSSITDGAVDVVHAISTQSLNTETTITDNPVVSDHQLIIASIENVTSIESGSVDHIHAISTTDLSSETSVSGNGIVQTHVISVDSLQTDPSVQEAPVIHGVDYFPADLRSTGTIESVDNMVATIIPLTDDLDTATNITSITDFQQTHVLNTQSLISDSFVEEIDGISVVHMVLPSDIRSTHIIESAIALLTGDLAVFDLRSYPKVGSVEAIVQHNIVLANVKQKSGSIKSLLLTQDHNLTIVNLTGSESSVKSLLITQDHYLELQDLINTGDVQAIEVFFGRLEVECPVIIGETSHVPPDLVSAEDPYVIIDASRELSLAEALCINKKVINL